MSQPGIYEISGSALLAQRQRLQTIASNLANANSITSAGGAPYRAREVVFRAVPASASDPSGPETVRVTGTVQSRAPFRQSYDPGSPFANKRGYVVGSNVSRVRQMTDLIDASRSYAANVAMLRQAQRIDQQIISGF
ncbi:MAG TPA: flagellar basal body rod protein FlgC [Gammaproteobacteria bacterium]|nr:flagellar basal body rod protein FlgC [Gammaproteobacteria bacterium]